MVARKKTATKKNIAADSEAFRLLFDAHPIPLVIYDRNSLEILRVNAAAVKLYGYTREEFKRANIADLLPEEEAARLSTALKGRNPALRNLGEWKNRLQGGALITVEVSSHALEFEGRKAVLVMAQDITARKRAEERLVELKKAVDTSNEAIFTTDIQGVFTYVNPGFTALYGYQTEEVVGKVTPRILKSGLVDPEFYVHAWKTLTEGRTVQGEIINKKKNGKLVDVNGSASPIFDDAGRITGYLGIQHDVSPRKQAEEALRIAEENYRSIFENATVGIYQSTPQGRFITVNPAMARIFGYDSPADMLERVSNIDKQYYVNPADRKTFHRLMNEHGKALDFCSWNHRKDGSRIWIRENARAVKDARGNISYYEGFVTDITEQKHAEDDLRRAMESLERANIQLESVLAREQRLARTDGLTGLYNYRYFFEAASREFAAAARYRHPLSVLMADADGFKRINDTYGHLRGDAMLAKIATAIAAQMRSSDLLARYGGDEFVALLPHADAQRAAAIAERVRASAVAVTMETEKEILSVSLSIGVADMRPEDNGIERIVQRADQALYAAKQNGRNRVEICGKE